MCLYLPVSTNERANPCCTSLFNPRWSLYKTVRQPHLNKNAHREIFHSNGKKNFFLKRERVNPFLVETCRAVTALVQHKWTITGMRWSIHLNKNNRTGPPRSHVLSATFQNSRPKLQHHLHLTLTRRQRDTPDRCVRDGRGLYWHGLALLACCLSTICTLSERQSLLSDDFISAPALER